MRAWSRAKSADYQGLDLRAHALLAHVPLHDVWQVELPGGGPDRTIADVRASMSAESLASVSRTVRALFGLRRRLGRLFGWDASEAAPAAPSLLDRLTEEDREGSLVAPGSSDGPFAVVYVHRFEALSEVRNATVHAFSVLALRPVPGGCRLFWAIYVAPVGRITAFYMALIDPFRRLMVYPAILRHVHRSWRASRNRAPDGRVLDSGPVMGAGRMRIVSAWVAAGLCSATLGVAPAGGSESVDTDGSWVEAEGHVRAAREIERDQPERAAQLYLDAARLFEAVARERPDFAPAYWRGARGFWMSGDTLPLEAKPERIVRFALAESMAATGIEVDAECAECMLWKFASMGRLRTTRGVWTGIRQLPEMAALLDRGISLAPSHRDASEEDSTLGNLHYSSAIFYRIFPDWFWIDWVVGVKGDKERALGHIETALALHPTRLDYQIELGSQLLCLGSARGDAERLAEGARVLRAALLREAETQDDAREQDAARVMIGAPPKACTYSGDTWVEIDREQALRAASAD